MVDQAVVGPPSVASIGVGSVTNFRAGQLGDLIVTKLHPAYYEQNYRGNVFTAANQSAATTTVGLATNYTGLCLSNPFSNVFNLVVNKASFMQSAVQSTQVEAFGLATGTSLTSNCTHTTPVTPYPCAVGSTATATGKVDAACNTLSATPVYTMFVSNTGTATANSVGAMVIDLEGSIVLKPGGFICWVTPAQASVAGMWFSFTWEEVPV